MQTIAIFGGSFNPPTRAHRLVVETVKDALQGVPVVVLPAPRVAHKDPATLAPFADRLHMARLAYDNMPQVTVSDFAEHVDSAQTVDLLDAYRAAHPDRRVIWVMGADSFVSLPLWERWEDIITTTPLFVLARKDQVDPIHHAEPAQRFAALETTTPETLLESPGWYLDTDFTAPFSATDVRTALARGEASPYLDPSVASFIATRGLYK